MKQLILTFFLVILCYSLFFDNEKVDSAKDEINYIQEDIFIPYLPYKASETVNYLTLQNYSTNWHAFLPINNEAYLFK